MLKPETHCGSYYAATINEQTGYPRLAGTHVTDVCVIGGGFTGVSTALTLAERGYKVTLLEQNKIGWGASGRNGGQMIGGTSGEEQIVRQLGSEVEDMVWTIGYRGHEIIEQRVAKYDIQCDLKHGYMDVAFKPRHMSDFENHFEVLQRRGFSDQARMVSAGELREVLGTDAYIGGLINNRNGHLHPLNLCIGEAKAAASLGVQIFEQTEVTSIVHGKKPILVTANGRVEADFVVLAGNAYHRLEQGKLSGLVFPAGSFIIATEPLSEAEVRDINPLDMAICDPNYVLDYYRLSAERRMLFGGRCNYSGRVPKSIQATMVPRMVKIFPQLKDKRIDFEWGGNIGIVVNRVPLLGRVANNVYYCMGYSGHGVNTSHVAGEIMADAISGTFERFDVFEKVRHRRIPFGQYFSSQMVAMGMLYFRLRDLL